MPLAFLAPAFLLALAAIAAPVVVHLRQRERREPVRFPSLMFLRAIAHRSTERRRIVHPWLLLFRAAALAAVAVAFSRPFWRSPRDRAVVARGGRTVILAIDRSLSMGYRGVLDRAKDSAAAALAGLGSGDRAALVTFDETAAVAAELTADVGGVRRALARIEPSGRNTRLAAGLRAARELAALAEGAPPEIVVISDFQRSALTGLESVAAPTAGRLRMVSVGAADRPNTRVVGAEFDRREGPGTNQLTVAATVAGSGGARAVKARLIVNGRPLAEATVATPTRGLAAVSFPAVTVPPGPALGAIALEPDDLPADDTLRFVVPVGGGVPIVLLDPAGDPEQSLYLERALEIGKAPSFAVQLSRRGMPAGGGDGVRTVVVTTWTGLGPGVVSGLERFVSDGGGLVAVASGPLPAWLPVRGGKVIEREPSSAGRWSRLDGSHPVLEPFREALTTDFGAARFFRYRDLVPDSAAVVPARFDDGRPALVEGRHGAGRILVVAAGLDARTGDLPVQPVFLPLVHRLVAYAGGIGAEARWQDVGAAVTVPDVAGDLTVRGPAGPGVAVKRGEAFVLDGPGFFEAASDLARAPVARWAANPSAEESDLAAVDPREALGQLRAPADSASERQPEAVAAAVDERNQSWWLPLLAVVLLLLGAETWQVLRLERARPRAGGAE